MHYLITEIIISNNNSNKKIINKTIIIINAYPTTSTYTPQKKNQK